MKRKITMITACILSCMLMVCVVPGSYAEMSDETILNENDSAVTEVASETVEEPGTIPDEAPAVQEEPAETTEENPAGEQQEEAGESGIMNDTEPEPVPETVPEPEPEPALEPDTETEPETVSEPAPEPAAEPESAEPADQPAEEAPEVTETEENEPAGEAIADPEEPDEDGLFEFDDDDHGYIEPSAMPEELAIVTPEMRFEGITELTIGSEVSGTAVGAPGTWHYIRSGSVRTVQLTLYAAADIQVQVNDRPVQFEATEDADGNECMACRVSLREGETYISLIGSSDSYRLKAAVPAENNPAEEEIRENEAPAEETDAENGDPAEAAEEPSAEESAADEVPAEAETADEPETAETAETVGDDPAGTDAEAAEPDPDRYVVIHSSIEGQKRVYSNSYVKLTAELFGYEGTDYTVQWYYSPDQGATRIAIPGADSLTYVYRVNDENIHYLWSVTVTPADGI